MGCLCGWVDCQKRTGGFRSVRVGLALAANRHEHGWGGRRAHRNPLRSRRRMAFFRSNHRRKSGLTSKARSVEVQICGGRLAAYWNRAGNPGRLSGIGSLRNGNLRGTLGGSKSWYWRRVSDPSTAKSTTSAAHRCKAGGWGSELKGCSGARRHSTFGTAMLTRLAYRCRATLVTRHGSRLLRSLS